MSADWVDFLVDIIGIVTMFGAFALIAALLLVVLGMVFHDDDF